MTSVPVPCGNGTYNSNAGAASVAACLTCTPGYNCPLGTAYPAPCNPGSFSGGGAATCTLCPQGTYQTLGGQSDCTNCTTGSWSCPEGAISPMWSAIPTPSPPPIPPGAAQVSGQITLAGDLASFDEASFKSNLATQLSTDCSCTINVADIVVATSAGSVVVEYTITAPDATAAAATQSTLTTPATLSTVLQVTVEGAGAFPSPPTMPPPPPPLSPPPPPYECGPGTFEDLVGLYGCVNCEAGKYNDLTAQTSCQPCTAGFYCPAVPPLGAIKPVPCPGGSYSAATNNTDASNCTQAAAGYYAPLGSDSEEPCPTGDQWSCPGGTDLPIDLGGGLAAGLEASCPAGTVLGPGGAADCQICPKGNYCRGGVANPCADGQWLNFTGAENNTACNTCPVGTLCPPATEIPNVRNGFFLSDPLNGRPAYRCPTRQACLGGLDYGELSCELGYRGLLCGGCINGYYRGKGSCLSCAALAEDMASSGQQIDPQASKNATMLLMVGGFAALVLVLAIYLRDPTKKPMFTIADIGKPIYFEEGEDWAGGGTTSIEMGISGLSWVRLSKKPKDGAKLGSTALADALLRKTVESVAEKRSPSLNLTLAEWQEAGGGNLESGGLTNKYLKKYVSSAPSTAAGGAGGGGSTKSAKKSIKAKTAKDMRALAAVDIKKYVYFIPLDTTGLKWLCTTKAPKEGAAGSEDLMMPSLADALCGKACELAERKQRVSFSEAEYREINIERLNTAQYAESKFGLYFMPATTASSASTLVKRARTRASSAARKTAFARKQEALKGGGEAAVGIADTVKETKVRMYKQGAGSAPELRDDGLFIRDIETKIDGLVTLEDGSIFMNPSGSAASASSKVLGCVERCLERYPSFGNGMRTFTGGKAPSILSGLVKIMISFMQCLGAINRFPLVKWPNLFIKFMDQLAIIDIEIFSVMPAECLTGKRLGFYFELLATLMVPILFCGLVLFLITLIHVLLMCRRANKQMRAKSWFWWSKGLGAEYNQPRVYVLMSWCALLFYPTMSRKSIQTLACTEAGVDEDGNTLFLMLADPEIRCWQGEHLMWVGICIGAILLYCIGIPALAFVLCKKWRNDTGDNYKRVALLVKTYDDDYWYGESASMLHRLFLTGVIHVIGPQTRLQLWVGSFFCFFFFVGFLLTKPMRYDTCDFVATAVLLQLFLTYLTAFLFFDDEGFSVLDPMKDEWGYMMVAMNSACFIVLLAGLAKQTLTTGKEMANARLRFKDDKTFVRLEPITKKTLDHAAENGRGTMDKAFNFSLRRGYHLFLSHAWPDGQDVMKICKQRCGLIVPTMRVFLDVDDLAEGSGSKELDHSAIVLVYAMTVYFKKVNCIKEFFRAILRKKPIVLLLADFGEEGAMTEDEVRAAISQEWVDEWFDRRLKLRTKWADDFEDEIVKPTAEEVRAMIFASPALTWSRITFLQNVTMRMLGHYALVSGTDSRLAGRQVELRSDTVWRATRLRPPIGHKKKGAKKNARPGKEYHLFVSRYNRGAMEVAMELGEVIHEGLGATQLKVTSDLDKLHECENFLVLLSGATWAIDENAKSKFQEELFMSFHLGVPLLPAHEAPTTIQDDLKPARLTWEITTAPDDKGAAVGWKGSLGDVHGRDLGEGNRPKIDHAPLQDALQQKFSSKKSKGATVSFSTAEWEELEVDDALKVFNNIKARQLNLYHVVANADATVFYQPARIDRKATEFRFVMAATPPDLAKGATNIFKQIAVPLRGGAWREAGLRLLYVKLVATQKSLRVRRGLLSYLGLGRRVVAVEKAPKESAILASAEAMKAQRARSQLEKFSKLFGKAELSEDQAATKLQRAVRRMIWIKQGGSPSKAGTFRGGGGGKGVSSFRPARVPTIVPPASAPPVVASPAALISDLSDRVQGLFSAGRGASGLFGAGSSSNTPAMAPQNQKLPPTPGSPAGGPTPPGAGLGLGTASPMVRKESKMVTVHQDYVADRMQLGGEVDSEMLEEAAKAVLSKLPNQAVAGVEKLIKMGSLSSSFMDAVEKELGIGERMIRPRREELVEIVTRLLVTRRASILASPRGVKAATGPGPGDDPNLWV